MQPSNDHSGADFATFLRMPSDRDEFFHIVAVNFQEPALCDRIAARADASDGGDWGGYESRIGSADSARCVETT